jgi:hypothetical protein
VILRAPQSTIRWLALLFLILFPAWYLLLLLKCKYIVRSICRAHHSNCELLLHIWLSLMVVIHQNVIRLLTINDIVCLKRVTSWIRIQILRKSCRRHGALLPHMQLDIRLLWWYLLQIYVSRGWTLILAVQYSQTLVISEILWFAVYILRKNWRILIYVYLLLLEARGSKLWIMPYTRNGSLLLLLLLAETCLWRDHPCEPTTCSRSHLFLMYKAVF